MYYISIVPRETILINRITEAEIGNHFFPRQIECEASKLRLLNIFVALF